jgi:dTDP-glucose 4,6-dehydratase
MATAAENTTAPPKPLPLSCVLVTGGCGFIASNFLQYMVVKYPEIHFVNVDKVDYCSTIRGVEHLEGDNYSFYPTNINNTAFMEHIITKHRVSTVMHFAAQSHVDNSFGNSLSFTQDNVLGTHFLLEVVRKCAPRALFIHVSTDEVYGEVGPHETCTEASLLNPTNPYAASKAAAEFIVKSYHKSYGLPIIITRGNNVYGPGQYPEKLIPKFILQLLNGQKMTVHGAGAAMRNFVYVADVVKAFELILFEGKVGAMYNIGSDNEHSVMDIARLLHSMLVVPAEGAAGAAPLGASVSFVPDRLFNDSRYCVDSKELLALGWENSTSFQDGLRQTIEWYKKTNMSRYFFNWVAF